MNQRTLQERQAEVNALETRVLSRLRERELQDEIAMLQIEIADLRADNSILRETLRECLAMLHKSQEQIARLRTCLRRDLWAIYGRMTEDKKRQAA